MASQLVGTTGYTTATITFLAAGPQAATGTTSAVDMTAVPRAVAVIDTGITDLGSDPELSVTFETGPTSSGPWTELTTVRMRGASPVGSPYQWQQNKRVPLPPHDDFVRLRWTSAARGPGSTNLRLGVTA